MTSLVLNNRAKTFLSGTLKKCFPLCETTLTLLEAAQPYIGIVCKEVTLQIL